MGNLEERVIQYYGSVKNFYNEHPCKLTNEEVKRMIESSGILSLMQSTVEDESVEEYLEMVRDSYGDIQHFEHKVLKYLEDKC